MPRPGQDLLGAPNANDPQSIVDFLTTLKADFDAHNHDGFNSRSFDNLIVQALIASGLLVGNSIYIPTLQAPLFSVDAKGNVVVSSLRRADYHWFTIFESIDGYSKNEATLNPDHVLLSTSTVSGDKASLQKLALYGNAFTWNKRRQIKIGVNFATVGTSATQIIWLCTGVGQDSFSTLRKIGFQTVNDNLYGVTADGTTLNQVLLQSFSINTNYDLQAILDPVALTVDFYVNGVKKGTSTANIPTGTSHANYLMDTECQTVTTASKSVRISYWDFWQAN